MIRIGGASQANMSASMVATLPAQPLDRVDLACGLRCDLLHEFEHAVRLRRKAIVKWLWCGADVMVLSGGQ